MKPHASPVLHAINYPNTLAFLGSVTGMPVTCLGVSVFGQGGGVDEVDAYHGLDPRSIVEAALDLVD